MSTELRTIHRGFTLMEVMVSISIFAIVVTVGIGALLTINNSYRKAQIDRQAIDSLTYTLESMSRRIRTASSWPATGYNTGATNSFDITDQDNIEVRYSLVGQKIMVEDPVGSSPYELTSDLAQVSTLSFLPLQTGSGQKYVQINVSGTVTEGQQKSDFNFQTGISKRSFE